MVSWFKFIIKAEILELKMWSESFFMNLKDFKRAFNTKLSQNEIEFVIY